MIDNKYRYDVYSYACPVPHCQAQPEEPCRMEERYVKGLSRLIRQRATSMWLDIIGDIRCTMFRDDVHGERVVRAVRERRVRG